MLIDGTQCEETAAWRLTPFDRRDHTVPGGRGEAPHDGWSRTAHGTPSSIHRWGSSCGTPTGQWDFESVRLQVPRLLAGSGRFDHPRRFKLIGSGLAGLGAQRKVQCSGLLLMSTL